MFIRCVSKAEGLKLALGAGGCISFWYVGEGGGGGGLRETVAEVDCQARVHGRDLIRPSAEKHVKIHRIAPAFFSFSPWPVLVGFTKAQGRTSTIECRASMVGVFL